MDSKERLLSLCIQGIRDRKLDGNYKSRLREEFIEVEAKDEYDYFLNLYDKGIRDHPHNDHNLLIPYLLGICSGCDIESEPAYSQGEFPDIDIDYLEPVADYLRNVWAVKKFGADYIASIGTYSTYDLKQSLLDMARIFGQDRNEALMVTKQFGLKDGDGNKLTWDTAYDLYPAFRTYIKNHPEVAEAAQRLCGRNRNMGQHAGGFIISSIPLHDFVPVVTGKNNEQLTAWPEGQSSQDLQEVGLVKLDTLKLKMIDQMKDCIGLIRRRHGVEHICNNPGQGNWSDTSYLNDPLCMEVANKGDLRFIFQLDSEGMRKLVRDGGVQRFEDIQAYISLYRPGALSAKTHLVYCKRKRGQEEYELHPALKPFLHETFGVMVYQEDVMWMLNKVGRVPMRDCYILVKAISKKALGKFAKYKDRFIENGQKILGWAEEEMHTLWSQIEAFAGYGFNRAHACTYAYIALRQLWLKTYYPIEFYASMMRHISGDEKLRDCKRDAEAHGVKIKQLDINKSNVHFDISDDECVYYGFADVKHVGEEVGKRIVSLRKEKPFTSFLDFLKRFGTEAKPVQALVSLVAFDEAKPLALWQYYEFYKVWCRRQVDRKKRNGQSMDRYAEQVNAIVGEPVFLSESNIELAIERANDEDAKKLRRILGNYRRSLTTFVQKEQDAFRGPPGLDAYEPGSLDKIKPDVLTSMQNLEMAQIQFYGFSWIHPLERCTEAGGLSFEKYRQEGYSYKDGDTGTVEGVIQSNREMTSKKNKDNKYRQIELLDINWEKYPVIIWGDDYERWRGELKVGALVRLSLTPPNPMFSGEKYAMESYPKWKPHLKPEKERDFRVILLDEFIKDDSEDVTSVTEVSGDDEFSMNLISKTQSSFRREDVQRFEGAERYT